MSTLLFMVATFVCISAALQSGIGTTFTNLYCKGGPAINNKIAWDSVEVKNITWEDVNSGKYTIDTTDEGSVDFIDTISEIVLEDDVLVKLIASVGIAKRKSSGNGTTDRERRQLSE